MSRQLYQLVQMLKSSSQLSEIAKFKRGIEKEGLRVTPKGTIAQTKHPEVLGAALTHPNITIDFAEAQLELITDATTSVDASLDKLELLHAHVFSHLDGELIWPGSMPCHFNHADEIKIAHFGSSFEGQTKHIYRLGLANRYGRTMQSISGIHFNFSVPEAFWQTFSHCWQTQQEKQAYISSQYFALMRNFNRHSWLLCYLFGASPGADVSFVDSDRHSLSYIGKDTLGLPYATSLRMSDLGYQSQAQSKLNIRFDSLSTYLNDLNKGLALHYSDYEEIDGTAQLGQQQLNCNLLQIENEFYSQIRPKQIPSFGESANQALRSRGVEYVEVRILDINPFLPLGLNEEQIRFLDMFLLYCLLSESPCIGSKEQNEIDGNLSRVIAAGRDPEAVLCQNGKCISLQEQANYLLDQMQLLAELLDSAQQGKAKAYLYALEEQKNKVENAELTPSGMLSASIGHDMSLSDLMLSLAQKHGESYQSRRINEGENQQLFRLALTSLASEKELADKQASLTES